MDNVRTRQMCLKCFKYLQDLGRGDLLKFVTLGEEMAFLDMVHELGRVVGQLPHGIYQDRKKELDARFTYGGDTDTQKEMF
jgi:hypothetical protein